MAGTLSLADFKTQYLNNSDIPNIVGKGVVLKNASIPNPDDFIQLSLSKDEWLLEFTRAVFKRY